MSEEALRTERQIEWLKTASPEDWHRVASSFDTRNDGSMDALHWIISQEECDKATALMVFWKTEPQNILAVMAEGRSPNIQPNRLGTAQLIARRLDEEGYERSNIAFHPGPYVPRDYDEIVGLVGALDPVPMPLCEDMRQAIAGKPVLVDCEFAKRYPPEFHNESIRERYLTALQIAHLEKGMPDDWHFIADNWNWDDELDVLYWIVSQPDCDRATALTTFWKGEPTGYDYETDDEEMGASPYSVAPMLRYISERFNTSGYPRSEIAFDYLEARGHSAASGFAAAVSAGQRSDIEELVDRQRDLPNSDVKIHPDMTVASLPGRKVRSSKLYDTFPAYFDIDGSDIGSGPVMNFDGEPVGATRTAPNRLEQTSEPDASARVRAMRGLTEAHDGEAKDTPSPSGLLGWIKRLFDR
ncbi:DUF4274 domain-containing protein [Qipengyuania sp. 6B39]|uniref:DUF4274 domain-containing protein n=1 Tax=Qipengyuania proteolytica TaxID=2867239 RepID=UPI001C89A743|nr:DUF4274 domain-containing protein [Qipengyuania proteolytica]MBX7494724.1 DUF4274 domain-containing protein [Qipengyuania proteolytica]